MQKIDLTVIGSGIGGSLISILNKDKNLVLFEKDKNLGGTASTFKRFGNYFNSGATTFVGYEDNHIIKEIFDSADFIPDLKKSSYAYRTIINGKSIDRITDFEEFIESLNSVFYHKNNRYFWQTLKDIDERFWKLKDIYFAKYSLNSYLKSLKTIDILFKEYKFLLFKSAKSFIKEVLGDISKEYQDFIDAQLQITLQSTSKDIPLLSFAIALSYPFHKIFYANGGMGKLFDDMLKDINVKKNEQIMQIKKENNFYRLISSKDEYLTSKLVLNMPVFECKNLFLDKNLQNYYKKFEFYDQSAFVIYLKIDSKKEFLNHYQIILKESIPNAVSKSFFVSFSHKDDEKLSKNGYSVTISCHTKALFWNELSKEEYEKNKEFTKNFILDELLKNIPDIKKEDIKIEFCATSKTFKRYINRFNCGATPLNLKNIFKIPSSLTPFKNLYNIGDSVFAGQGWPGVALGVKVLNSNLFR
ncbi:phytoene desaturase family protein [Aliarcobacter butzleri]|uniref:phytoene desaturase family protein n=1 Tax=Aliarcobacter butzleri TaxID=28197 RepID=UPI00125F30EC|nr:NAD(P)-binding protein [Aliarcobacter butzleri]MCG3657090.1 NAD(P)-binding protein [Aliarcobacter butzleri]MCT7557444.1 NAD(P)-binding protein [Aliarcobacter butzleri]MCT7595739.1 NAD(P)-binding protein [Aliarcobacter butzleri]MCT7600243.1 NAD(P)-binding protein [Aliarcobacter butzleri]MCT7653562.1 NAD(P)-binding protein [Aliarcobacter butzleri]